MISFLLTISCVFCLFLSPFLPLISAESRPWNMGRVGRSPKRFFPAPRASVWSKNRGQASRAPSLDPPLLIVGFCLPFFVWLFLPVLLFVCVCVWYFCLYLIDFPGPSFLFFLPFYLSLIVFLSLFLLSLFLIFFLRLFVCLFVSLSSLNYLFFCVCCRLFVYSCLRRNRVLSHLELFSARLPVKVFKTQNGRQSHFLSKFHKSKKFSRSELS